MGTATAKLERDHPNLYAARHVAIALVQLPIGLVGIGAIVRGLLPRLDAHINIPFPALAVPEWLRAPFRWYNDLTVIPVGWSGRSSRGSDRSLPFLIRRGRSSTRPSGGGRC